MPSSGPSAKEVQEAPASSTGGDLKVVELSSPVLRRLVSAQRQATFVDSFGSGTTSKQYLIGPGDSLEISVWEAPPATLFGSAVADPRGLSASSARVAVLPEQTVNDAGQINVPFAGSIKVSGLAPDQVEKEVARRLKGKANDPQVLVRVLRNTSSMVTVVGEVNTNTRLPLSPRGERLLDALAASGGFRQPVGKITIRLTREVLEQNRKETRVVALPLETILTDPMQNILLQPGDVITALYQPNSFTVLGATARNEEINFEAQGITLSQAMARAGGLQDQRANPTAVFIFRFEKPEMVGEVSPQRTTVDGRIPVIYWVDLKNPASFFLAQDFPMRNRDVLYVANAPGAELQKFMNLLSSLVFPLNYYNGLN
jgi:polysaccharide biosynthesis/export protein